MTLQNSEALNNLYRLYGVCAHHCANIEYRIGFLLYPSTWEAHQKDIDLKFKEIHRAASSSIEEYLVASKQLDEVFAKVDKAIEKLDDLPLGELISRFKKANLPEDCAKYLEDILKKRNYLIHKVWGIYGRRLSDMSTIKKMTDELTVLEHDFRVASDWLKKHVHALHGLDEQSIPMFRKRLKITGRRRHMDI